jgi:hypothetical protein
VPRPQQAFLDAYGDKVVPELSGASAHASAEAAR